LGFCSDRNGGKGDLGGVEKFGAGVWLDGTDKNAVADAGDEVADILLARQRGKCEAENHGSITPGDDPGLVLLQGQIQ